VRVSRLSIVAAVLIAPSIAFGSNCAGTSTGNVPLMDLGTGTYLGQFQGGLYPGGSNAMPAVHATAGLAAAAQIVPRNTSGTPDPQNGKVVLISVGMSNTTGEFCIHGEGTTGCTAESFMGQAAVEPAVNHTTLAIINGARSGQDAVTWLDPPGRNYDDIATLLTSQGLSEAQVQVAWVKEADIAPTVSLPSSNADAYVLEGYLGAITRALATRYPNLQQVFFSSRIYAGYADVPINPEPYAYEGGFAVKWVVQAQISQVATPGHPADATAGDLDYTAGAPWIGWGPYLWADGTTPRSDGLTYLCSDLQNDGTHPMPSTVQKVGGMLLDFFLTSPMSQPWFTAAGATTTTTTTTITTSSTSTTTLPPECPPMPVPGCQLATPRRAELRISRGDTPARNTVKLKWLGSSVTKTMFGDPTTTSGYVLCLYDAAGMRIDAAAPAGGSCGKSPCWKDVALGFRYGDPALTPAGVRKLTLRASRMGMGRITVQARGANLDVPTLPLAAPVTAQVQRSDTAQCWEATFSSTPSRNDARQLRARSD